MKYPLNLKMTKIPLKPKKDKNTPLKKKLKYLQNLKNDRNTPKTLKKN